CQERQGDRQSALKYISEAIQLDPSDPNMYLIRGNIYATLHSWDSALADFDILLRLVPSKMEVLAAKANVLVQLNRSQEARAALKHIVNSSHDEKLTKAAKTQLKL